MVSDKIKIGLLVAAHFVATPALVWLLGYHNWPHPIAIAWAAMPKALMPLLAIVLIFGSGRIYWRILLVVCGVFFKVAFDYRVLLQYGREVARQFTWDQLVNDSLTVIVATALLAWVSIRHQIVRGRPGISKTHPFQFSLQDLMLLIFTVSVLFAFDECVRRHEGLTDIRYCVSYVVPITFLAPSAIWATMTPGGPHLRVVVAILGASGLGVWEAHCRSYFDDSPDLFTFHVTTNALTALVVIYSLLVVRSCDWRLVPRSRPDTSTQSAES